MTFSTAFPGFLLVIASVSTVAICLATVATSLLRRSTAALRHLLWLMALGAPLVALPFAWMHFRIEVPIVPPALVHPAPFSSGQFASPEFAVSARHDQAPKIAPAASALAPDPRPIIILNLWSAAWFLGFAIFLARLFLSHARVRRLIREGCHPAPRPLLHSLARMRESLHVRGPVRLLVTPFLKIPFCHGTLRPSIVLPEGAQQWPDQRLAICLAHELAHLRRGDLLALFLGQVVGMCCWFNPLVWYAVARLREEAEKSADDLVLAQNIPPTVYAADLVAMTEKYQASLFPSLSALSMARPNRLKGRVEAILDSTLRRHSPGRVTALAISLLSVGLVASAMAVKLTAAAPASSDPAPAADLAHLDPRLRAGIWTMASEAIKKGDLKTVDSLLKRGLNVNADLVSHCSLLFLAADANQLPIVQLLLAKGADLNQKTSWGDTPLRRACWRGNKEVADTLIAAGAPVDPLLYATGMGEVAALDAIEKQRPISPKEAREALNFAVASGHQNSFGWLWKRQGPLDGPQKEKLLGDLYESAGKWGQVGILQYLQTLGADPVKYDREALCNAVCWNFPATVKYLLEKGVSPNVSAPGWGNMLRDSAGEADKLEIVKLLLAHGADPNVLDEDRSTSLGWAAYNGNEEICLLLLKHGADGRIEDKYGENAAWKAAGGAHCPQTLELLIKQGVKVTGRNKNGNTIFSAMMCYEPPSPGKVAFPGRIYTPSEILDYNQRERRTIDLLVESGLDFNGAPGTETPLMAALQYGHYAAASALLAHGADLSITDQEGNPALVYLFNFPGTNHPFRLDVLEELLKYGANPNLQIKSSGKPPAAFPLLEEAIGFASNPSSDTGSFRQAIKILLDHGAIFPVAGNGKIQALLQAAARGDLTALQKEVVGGTSINSADANGWNALTIATALGYDDCSGWLLAQGADVATHTSNGDSPISLAIQRGQTALVKALIAKGARPTGGIYYAVDQNNQPIFDALIQAGVDVKDEAFCTITSGGVTFRLADSVPLFLCIKNGNSAMAKTLLDKGANPDPANLENNRNLVYWAVYYNRPEILEALLARGANPSVKDSEGMTPLLLAQKSHQALVPILEKALHAKPPA